MNGVCAHQDLVRCKHAYVLYRNYQCTSQIQPWHLFLSVTATNGNNSVLVTIPVRSRSPPEAASRCLLSE